MLCNLLAMLYVKYLRELILAAISGVNSDGIFSSSCLCTCSLMAMTFRSALLSSFKTKPSVFCLDVSVMVVTPQLYGSLKFPTVQGKTPRAEHWQRKESLFVDGQDLAVVEYFLNQDKLN